LAVWVKDVVKGTLIDSATYQLGVLLNEEVNSIYVSMLKVCAYSFVCCTAENRIRLEKDRYLVAFVILVIGEKVILHGP
jgi:hypothetical protein